MPLTIFLSLEQTRVEKNNLEKLGCYQTDMVDNTSKETWEDEDLKDKFVKLFNVERNSVRYFDVIDSVYNINLDSKPQLLFSILILLAYFEIFYDLIFKEVITWYFGMGARQFLQEQKIHILM